jgi:hypothetical protein
VAAALPVLDSDGVATFVKTDVKHSTPGRSFLRRDFLNPSSVVQVSPHYCLKCRSCRHRLWFFKLLYCE